MPKHQRSLKSEGLWDLRRLCHACLVSGTEDCGKLRPPVIGVLVGVLLLLQENALFPQRLYDGSCALIQNRKTCMQ